MPEFVNACPLCCYDRHKLLENTLFRGSIIENQICLRCGFVFQSPRMTSEELQDFYTQSYREVYQGQESPIIKDVNTQRTRAENLLAYTKKFIPQVNNFLDIGSSAGILLERFQESYDCGVVGVEPGDAYRKFSCEKGLIVHPSLEAIRERYPDPFDLISMIHVLEHIPDPVSYLTELQKDLLSREGYLLLEVPNLYFHNSFEIAHLSSFSQHTIKETLTKAGFSVVTSKAHGFPRSKLLPLYLTILAQPMGGRSHFGVKPERWVRQKRDLGMFYRRIVLKLLPKLSWTVQNQNL